MAYRRDKRGADADSVRGTRRREPMSADPIRGGLFPPDFLTNAESLGALGDWAELTDEAVDAYEERLRGVFKDIPSEWSPNESVTEDEVIWPVLRELGWTSVLRQVNASAVGRHDIPDGIMYLNDEDKSRAMGVADARAQYAIGKVLVEAKKWLAVHSLCRRSGLAASALSEIRQEH